MGVYHITYTKKLKQICLFFNGGCNFSCHGCITDHHPNDCHLKKENTIQNLKNSNLTIEQVIAYLKPFSFDKVIFLGKEPILDLDFLSLIEILKQKFFTYNILLTNGYQFIKNKSIDEICIGIKSISKKLFKDFTGQNNPEKVLNNLKKYINTPYLKVRAESIFIPNYIDIDEIEKIAKYLSEIDSLIPYRIDGYIPYSEDEFKKPTKQEMEKAQKIAKKYLKNTSILYHGISVKNEVKKIY